jgi:small conductance mechanosensitive channel
MMLQASDTTTVNQVSLEELTKDPQVAIDLLASLAIQYGPPLIKATLVLLIGSWLIKRLNKLVLKALNKGSFDKSLRTFLASLLKFALYVMLFITVLGFIGVPMTSFLTILGAAGLAIGLALQGSLSNFAGGVLILAFKPFKIGDVIDSQGEVGTVERIDILHTHLKTPDNRVVVMPNGALANSNLTNITHEPKRRMDFSVGIAYHANVKKAKQVIAEVFEKDERVLKEDGVLIFVSALADSSVNLSVRVWATTDDYWPLYFDGLEMIKEALDHSQIEIPFPQRVVHTKVAQG